MYDEINLKNTTDLLFGVNPGAVIERIKNRIYDFRNNRTTNDGRRLALVLEGGGMRAAAPAGGTLALLHMGANRAFDDIYATSAAVMNGSYFITGQGDLGIRVYFEDLASKKFCDPRRLWKIIDVDYVINEVVGKAKPLDCERARDSKTTLHVSVIDRDTGEAFVINTQESQEPLLRILHAAIAIPLFYNRSIQLMGRRCIDGGLSIPFPLQQAVDEGCTDILVLSSKTFDYEKAPAKPWQKAIFNILAAHFKKPLQKVFEQSHIRSRRIRDLALGKKQPPPGVNIATVCLDADCPIKRMTTDSKLLRESAVSYGRKILKIFGANHAEWNLDPASCNEEERLGAAFISDYQ